VDDVADDRARAQLRKLSRGLTGKAEFRLEVALAICHLGQESFRVIEVCALLAADGPGRSDNASRNLRALLEAGLLQQATEGGPYHRDTRHPFWTFVGDTWSLLLAQARSVEAGEAVLRAFAEGRPQGSEPEG
jgi:hypothetical protein